MPWGRRNRPEPKVHITIRLDKELVAAVLAHADHLGVDVTTTAAATDLLRKGIAVAQLSPPRVSPSDSPSTGVKALAPEVVISETEAPPKKQKHLDQRASARGGSRKPAAGSEAELPEWLPRETWAEWCQYRREKGQTLKPTTVRYQLRQLAAWHEQGYDLTEIIRQSITQGYTGLFEARGSGAGRTRAGAAIFKGDAYGKSDPLPPGSDTEEGE